MKKRGMRGVDADFERLQPVAIDMAFEGETVCVGRSETVEPGQGGRLARVRDKPRSRHSFHAPHKRLAAHARTGGCHRVPPAFRGTGLRYRTASRERRSAGRHPPAAQTRDRRRDAGSRGRAAPTVPLRSRNSTKSWPSTRTARSGRSGTNSSDSAIRVPIMTLQRSARRAGAYAHYAFVLFITHHGDSPFCPKSDCVRTGYSNRI